jgi:tRNA (guanine-N7-)-methyltransferase
MSRAPRDPRDHPAVDHETFLDHDILDREAPPEADAGRRFFGRRKGHKLRVHQLDLIAQLLPRLALDIEGSADHPKPSGFADLAARFNQPVGEVRLEIGFGGGEHLIAEARAFPDTGFIGCEPYVNGMAKILAQIESHDIGNIRLFAGDAAELLAWAPPLSLARIDLIHPDPWPKRRHWKRRFVQDSTVAAMARILKASGEFRFVCDIDDYVAWTLAHLARSPDFAWTAERAADWRAPWPGYTMTRYGKKAEREGRKAAYLRFCKIS